MGLCMVTIIDRPFTEDGIARIQRASKPFDRVTECPNLVRMVEEKPDGEVFELFGKQYRRQSDFQPGDTVLYVSDGSRLYGGKDSVLIDGRMVTKRVRELRYARMQTADGFVCTEHSADGKEYNLIMKALFDGDWGDTVHTPLAVEVAGQ